MLPHLPGLNGPVAGGPVQVPPPPGFQPPVGQIINVQHEPRLNVLNKGTTTAQKTGLRYEAKVQSALRATYSNLYWPNPAFSWRDDRGKRYCEMDGLLHILGRLVCIEIKFQHMAESWWQLRKKYELVLERWDGINGDDILLLEICNSLDPVTPYPEVYTYVEKISDFILQAKDGELGVFQWRL